MGSIDTRGRDRISAGGVFVTAALLRGGRGSWIDEIPELSPMMPVAKSLRNDGRNSVGGMDAVGNVFSAECAIDKSSICGIANSRPKVYNYTLLLGKLLFMERPAKQGKVAPRE